MELKNLNLVELDAHQAEQIDGGIWGYLFEQISSNWKEIKKGAVDGWNGTYH
ncbi:hypothetical protein [Chryseobacterium viscerum]|uniref:hypothetical protein n=1 Tax=Chryseobacterium viscerum TaxID=1037377 RepID=UPI00140416CB|nr:hypothetical protein [Chryseobacterium viscerum]